MKRRPAGKNIELIKKYLQSGELASAANIAKFAKVKGNIYTTLSKMVSQGILVKKDKMYKLSDDPRMPLFGQRKEEKPKADAPVHPLIKMFQEEIEDIDAGIRSLQITRSYMVRRIEYIRTHG